MDFIEFTGKTVDDALTNALNTSPKASISYLDHCLLYVVHI